MKVPVNSIRAGNVIEYNGRLWVASKVQHITPGKGGAFVAIEEIGRASCRERV